MKGYKRYLAFLFLYYIFFAQISISQTENRNIFDRFDRKEKGFFSKVINKFFSEETFNKSYAIVIGLSDYEIWDQLESPYYDALKVKDFLINTAKFDYVVTITNKKATKEIISKCMEEIFPKIIGNNDRFLFYFSGHGTQRILHDGVRGYLPMLNSGKETWSDMISMEDVERWNRNIIKARHVLFIFDCCFSGLAGIEKKGDEKKLYLQDLAQYGHHIITAGTKNQISYGSMKDWGGSLFTFALIQGISGKADFSNDDYPKDKIISLYELFEYIRKKIKEEATKNQTINQSPQIKDLGDSEGEFFFIFDEKIKPLLTTDTGEIEQTSKGKIEQKGKILKKIGKSALISVAGIVIYFLVKEIIDQMNDKKLPDPPPVPN